MSFLRLFWPLWPALYMCQPSTTRLTPFWVAKTESVLLLFCPFCSDSGNSVQQFCWQFFRKMKADGGNSSWVGSSA